jgi:hypothetical protein
MILILASRWDAGAAALASRWRAYGARLLTPVDLSRPGWCWDPAEPLAGDLAVGSDVVPVSSVAHVVSVMSAIQPSELHHIAPEDRDYVAAEVSAFLVAWLTSLRGRVLNPPTPLCLSGPHLRDAQWRRDAALAGLPVAATRRTESCRPGDVFGTTDAVLPPSSAVEVAVVGGSCVAAGSVPPGIHRGVEALAARTGAGLLSARLLPGVSGAPWWFDGARAGVDLTAAGVPESLERCLGLAS